MLFGMPIEDALAYPVIGTLLFVISGAANVTFNVLSCIFPPPPDRPQRWG